MICNLAGVFIIAGMDDLGADIEKRPQLSTPNAIGKFELLGHGVCDVGFDDLYYIGGSILFSRFLVEYLILVPIFRRGCEARRDDARTIDDDESLIGGIDAIFC
jgi:hypothetical protein